MDPSKEEIGGGRAKDVSVVPAAAPDAGGVFSLSATWDDAVVSWLKVFSCGRVPSRCMCSCDGAVYEWENGKPESDGAGNSLFTIYMGRLDRVAAVLNG
jgi:hypothetical protein